MSDNETWVPLDTALDGKEAHLTKRERYQVVLGADGNPSLLFTGAEYDGVDFNIVTPFVI